MRDVPMPLFLQDAITRHLAELALSDGDVLCRTPKRTLLRRDYYNREIWKPALAAAGMAADTTFHDLRHTTVDLYGHLVPEASGRTRDALDRAFAWAGMCPESAPTA
jgi:integrase